MHECPRSLRACEHVLCGAVAPPRSFIAKKKNLALFLSADADAADCPTRSPEAASLRQRASQLVLDPFGPFGGERRCGRDFPAWSGVAPPPPTSLRRIGDARAGRA